MTGYAARRLLDPPNSWQLVFAVELFHSVPAVGWPTRNAMICVPSSVLGLHFFFPTVFSCSLGAVVNLTLWGIQKGFRPPVAADADWEEQKSAKEWDDE